MAERSGALLEIGRIDRVHGLRGEVLVSLTTNVEDRLVPGCVVFAGTQTIRLEVVGVRAHGQRWIVQFAGYRDRDAATALHGLLLYAEELDDPDAFWVHQMIGATVVDGDGICRGTVVAVVANPASDLLELDSGVLVPLTFVTGWGDGGSLEVHAPLGLFGDELR